MTRGRNKPPFASVQRNIVKVPGVKGGYLQNSEVDTLVISQPIAFKIDDDEDNLRKMDELKQWLITDNVAPLEFPDEPGRIYYAVVQNTIEDLQRIANSPLKEGTIQFLCPEPYAFGVEQPRKFESSELTVINNGNEETFPTFEVTATSDLTYLQITNQDSEYMMIGKPMSIDDLVVDPSPIVKASAMGDINEWTTVGVLAPEGGVIDGTFGSDGDLFSPSNYGTTSTDPAKPWHGPGLRLDLNNPIQDFLVEVSFSFRANSAEEVGREELYLIGTNETFIGKLAIKDIYTSTSDPVGEVRIGDLENGQMIVSGNGYMKRSYDQFYGKLWIKREGKTITGQIGEFVKGELKNRMNPDKPFEDESGSFQTQLTAVQVHAGRYKGLTPITRNFIHQVTIRELVPVTNGYIPLIARTGDVITIDHQNSKYLINGEPPNVATQNKDFGATYFPLKKGENKLYTFPVGAFDTRLTYRERY